MVDITAIGSVAQSLKTTLDLVHGLRQLVGRAAAAPEISQELVDALEAEVRKLQAEVYAAHERALAAQAAQRALTERVDELERELLRNENWTEEQARYTLTAVDRGAFAYVQKPDVQTAGEPPYWLCTRCFENQRKSYLQFHRQPPSGGHLRGDRAIWRCPACQAEINVYYTRTPDTA